jgi:hypothetical protein
MPIMANDLTTWRADFEINSCYIQVMGETGLVPEVADDPKNVKLFELMYLNVSKDLWEPLIPVSSNFGPPLVNILLISFQLPNVCWCRISVDPLVFRRLGWGLVNFLLLGSGCVCKLKLFHFLS